MYRTLNGSREKLEEFADLELGKVVRNALSVLAAKETDEYDIVHREHLTEEDLEKYRPDFDLLLHNRLAYFVADPDGEKEITAEALAESYLIKALKCAIAHETKEADSSSDVEVHRKAMWGLINRLVDEHDEVLMNQSTQK